MKQISKPKFQELLQDAATTGDFQSYIGYPETARLIEQLTGIEIEVSREQAGLSIGDVMLIVKLRQRIQNLSDISTYQPSLDDLDFFLCNWQPLSKGETSC